MDTSISVKQASALDKCHIVSLEWLLESKDKKKKMAEKKFLVGDKDDQQGSTAQNAVAPAPATVSDKKRTASAAVDGVQRPSKKKRDEQKTEEKKIHVPVDEGCKEGGKLCWFSKIITLWLIDLAGYEVLIDAEGVIWVCFDPLLLFRLWLIRAGRLAQLD